ncbi:hypothetical protein Acear_1377 [Acetohalobium arabaticum DSM 5501]|uniref:Uncharacterized protein n=1 Tax=Acetohalobium arabaticum (strain ATCC 49924 / DSM 5501 / Z-7288) TaxID=574087 RepID=D9QQU9_ACEAZ|nr:hypothetical protein Acear_1377 [Acetohalobium arabaticum DSM 5501]
MAQDYFKADPITILIVILILQQIGGGVLSGFDY